jgi:cytochrome c551/c552
MVDPASGDIKGVRLSEDGTKVRIVVDNLRKYYVHHIELDGIRSAENELPLLHNSAYYTLNEIPSGEKLTENELSTYNSMGKNKKQQDEGTENEMTADTDTEAAPSYETIKPMLSQYTCSSCHSTDERKVGPPFTEIAKRNYSNKKMVELMYNPDLSNWPDYATAMPPMTIVPEDEALQIAEWINSLND